MLQLSESLTSKHVLSLMTGAVIGSVQRPIINPKNLKVEGFYVKERRQRELRVMLYQDIRDVIKQGFVVNGLDALTPPDELVRLKKLLELDFRLHGKPVYTISKERIGKVSDFAIEVDTMYVQKLYVSRSILKSLSTHSLSVDRNQIHEITNHKVIIQDLLQVTPASAGAVA